MSEDPYYQMWSALRRTGMEMRQQAGRSLVLRQIQALRDRARQLNAECAATLRLDESIAIPRYQCELDNHCMPGSYYAEYIEDDVSAAANYGRVGGRGAFSRSAVDSVTTSCRSPALTPMPR